MLKVGYNKRFAAGVVAAGGTLASLIPPSAILVIYAIIVEQDVGKLLLAGFIPGAFSAIIYGLLIVGIAVVFKTVGPPVTGFTWKERFAALPGAIPIVAVILIIICFVYNPVWRQGLGHPYGRWCNRGLHCVLFRTVFMECAGKNSNPRFWKPPS